MPDSIKKVCCIGTNAEPISTEALHVSASILISCSKPFPRVKVLGIGLASPLLSYVSESTNQNSFSPLPAIH